MVARIKWGKSMRGAINYNENKVSQRKANIIMASGFSCDISELSFSGKIKRFENLISKQERGHINTLHLSLNFSPGEALDAEKLQFIAKDYMDRIGFAGQPYLVYEHTDAGHPHIHIVTTTIKESGRPIDIHNICRLKSEPARKLIEIEYNLVKAEDQNRSITTVHSKAQLQNTIPETKRTISNSVEKVLSQYKFSNLEEFNAILKNDNVVADPGLKNSRMSFHQGLVFYILDKNGNKAGLGIKASSIFVKPTLKNLNKLYPIKNIQKQGNWKYFKKVVTDAVSSSCTTNELINTLNARDIEVILIDPKLSNLENLIFVDHKKKSAFRFLDLQISQQLRIENLDRLVKDLPDAKSKNALPSNSTVSESNHFKENALLNAMLDSSSSSTDMHPDFLKKKKKKKKPRY